MRRLALLPLLLVLLAPARAQEPVDLRLRLDVGDSFTQRTTVQQDIEQTVMGTAQTIKQNIGITTRFDVEAATEDVYGIRATYTGVRFEMNGPMGAVRYDSDSPPAEPNPMSAGYAALAGQSFTFTADPAGHVLAVEGIEAMLSVMVDAVVATDEAQREAMKKSLEAQFGSEAVRGQLESTFALYPDAPVAVGDTWTREVALRAGMPMDLTNTYRLERVEGGEAVIAVTGTITTGDGPPMDMGGAKIAFDLDGTQSGHVRLDRASGMVRGAEFEQAISGEAVVNGSMTLPMEITSAIETETLD